MDNCADRIIQVSSQFVLHLSATLAVAVDFPSLCPPPHFSPPCKEEGTQER